MIRIGPMTAVAALIGLTATGAFAHQDMPTLKRAESVYAVKPDLFGEDDKKPQGVSGIACMPPSDGRRRCLVVNDENTGAQFVEIAGQTITPGDMVDLIGAKAPSDALGTAPAERHCSDGEGKFGEFDGEGVAYADGYFYVVGSHGCSRNKNKFKGSAFFLARIPVDAHGARSGPVERTYRLGDRLAAAQPVCSALAHDLGKDKGAPSTNGLNIEGIAIVDTVLFAGLRAPSLGENAFLVKASISDLFAPGQERGRDAAGAIPLAIGKWSGIRDLAVLPDKRLLVLTGPAQDQDVPYALFTIDPDKSASLTPVGRFPKPPTAEKDGKAEAVVQVADDRFLVLFDSLKNGGPRDYEKP